MGVCASLAACLCFFVCLYLLCFEANKYDDDDNDDVTSAGWQVTLCDPMWHVSFRSGVATLRTAIHLLLTYLLYSRSW